MASHASHVRVKPSISYLKDVLCNLTKFFILFILPILVSSATLLTHADPSPETLTEVDTLLDFNIALKKLPSQSPAPDEVPASTSLIKTIRRAQSLQKSRGDTHLAVDQLILGLLEDSQIGDLLKEAGVSASRVKSEVEKLRGKEGKKVESASGDTNFQALKTYGRDLGEQARKLDPVIGRDEEIRSD